jgi:hypothetical protein
LRVSFELIPERKGSALPGSDWINPANTIDGVEKAADIFAINQPLLKGKPVIDFPEILICKYCWIHI